MKVKKSFYNSLKTWRRIFCISSLSFCQFNVQKAKVKMVVKSEEEKNYHIIDFKMVRIKICRRRSELE